MPPAVPSAAKKKKAGSVRHTRAIQRDRTMRVTPRAILVQTV
jgi:hypothetical protein